MNSRTLYELTAVRAITAPFRAPPVGMSDEDRDNEYRSQRMLFEAYGKFVSVAQASQTLTDIRKDQIGDLLSAMSDFMPDPIAWSEAISDARRGL